MNIWIIRKHPVIRHVGWYRHFYIDEICYTKENAQAKVKRLNFKSRSYFYSVQKLAIKEQT